RLLLRLSDEDSGLRDTEYLGVWNPDDEPDPPLPSALVRPDVMGRVPLVPTLPRRSDQRLELRRQQLRLLDCGADLGPAHVGPASPVHLRLPLSDLCRRGPDVRHVLAG